MTGLLGNDIRFLVLVGDGLEVGCRRLADFGGVVEGVGSVSDGAYGGNGTERDLA